MKYTATKRRGLRLAVCVAFYAVSLVSIPPLVLAGPGDLDLTFAGFGTRGKTPVNTLPATCVALQPDGRIAVAGFRGVALVLVRYLSNGVRDATFGGGTVTHINAQYAVRPTAMAVQTNGRIVLAGKAEDRSDDFLLARLTIAGDMDPSFGGDGFVTTDFAGQSDWAKSVIIQPDGKIVAAGVALVGRCEDFAVARYNPDGSLDTTFSGDGKLTIGFGGDDTCADIALQDDGKLVLVGTHRGTFDADFAVARLHADGVLDESFGGDGKITTGFGSHDQAETVAIQPDGKIVVAGNQNLGNSLMVRYLPNGVDDFSFGAGGKLEFSTDKIHDVAVQPDGKILHFGVHFALNGDGQFGFHRLNPDGSPDATFDGNGRAFIEVGDYDIGWAIALQADGRIIGYGTTGRDRSSQNAHGLVRLWPDGTLDAGGQQTAGFQDPFVGPGSHENAHGMAVQTDGKIVVAGQIRNATDTESDFALARFLADGRPDTSFGAHGQVVFGFGGEESARAVAVQRDGKIVAAGYSQIGTGINFMVARFRDDGTPDPEFAFFGFNVLDFFGGDDYANALALAPDDKIVVAGTAFNGAQNVLGVARFLSDGTVDNAFDVDGKRLFEFAPRTNHWASAVVVQPDRKIVVGGHVDRDFALVRFNANGSVDQTFGSAGATLTDMGGDDFMSALVMREGSDWFIAAGTRFLGANGDFALAQYMSNGVQPTGGIGSRSWPGGKAFVDWGGSETALAVDWRSDGRVAVAGCTDTGGSMVAWAELPPAGLVPPIPIQGTTDFVGGDDCAFGVKFHGSRKVVVAGTRTFNGDRNFALARFEATSRIGGREFLRGDCNDDGEVDISDTIATLGALFLGQGEIACEDACDSNHDGTVDISDAIATLGALFLGNGVISLRGTAECDVDS